MLKMIRILILHCLSVHLICAIGVNDNPENSDPFESKSVPINDEEEIGPRTFVDRERSGKSFPLDQDMVPSVVVKSMSVPPPSAKGRNPREDEEKFAREFVSKNNLNLEEEPLPMNEVLNDITDLYEKLPKPLKVVAAPNFGSLIRTMHSIKNELDKMQQRKTRNLEILPRISSLPTMPTPASWRDNQRIENINSISLDNDVIQSRKKLVNNF